MMHRALLVASLAFAALAAPAAAQSGKAGKASPGVEGQKAPRRAELEQQVRENFAAELRKRLQLTDDQMTKMMAVNQRLDAERRELFQQERATRMALRTELQVGDNAVNQARVGELLDTMLRLQRNRLDLVEREHRELSAFLTPVQRARYQAFVDFMQRRMDDMSDGRARGEGRRGSAPGGQGRGGTRPPPPPAAAPSR
jgi:hypothetical protein